MERSQAEESREKVDEQCKSSVSLVPGESRGQSDHQNQLKCEVHDLFPVRKPTLAKCRSCQTINNLNAPAVNKATMKLDWITTLKSTDHKAAWPEAQVRMHSLSRLLFGRGYDLLPSMVVESALYDTGHISISCRYVRLQSHKQTRFPITQA